MQELLAPLRSPPFLNEGEKKLLEEACCLLELNELELITFMHVTKRVGARLR